ncbi:MAG: Bifunctional protein Aas [Anaerolineales bacterium]|nr:Bifunctional protein Aas [Anaerolineales bacterium]
MRNIIRTLVRLIITLVAKVEIRGREYIPRQGGFVVATNHLGLLDAAMAFYTLDQWELFLPVAEKWEENGFLRWIGKHLNFIFVDRFHPDLKAMREMIRRMEEGQTLIIAPEGTRARDEKMAQAKAGVAYLAAKSGFPILPVALAGTEDRIVFGNLKRLRRSRVQLTGGPSFVIPPLPKENREEFLEQWTDEIMCRIAMMLPKHNRGYYADHPRLKQLLNESQAE